MIVGKKKKKLRFFFFFWTIFKIFFEFGTIRLLFYGLVLWP